MCLIYVMFNDGNISMTLSNDEGKINGRTTLLNNAYQEIKSDQEALNLAIQKYTMYHAYLVDVRTNIKAYDLTIDNFNLPIADHCPLCQYHKYRCNQCAVKSYNDGGCLGTAWDDLYNNLEDLDEGRTDEISQEGLLNLAVDNCLQELNFLKFIKEAEYEGALV